MNIANYPEASQAVANANGPFAGQDGSFMAPMSKISQ